jgi:hypothetical protein
MSGRPQGAAILPGVLTGRRDLTFCCRAQPTSARWPLACARKAGVSRRRPSISGRLERCRRQSHKGTLIARPGEEVLVA